MDESIVLIEHVDVIDGCGTDTVRDCSVTITGTKIERVGPSGTAAPHHTRVVDGRGCTAIPGLIDVHMHDPGDANAELYLRNGVTSIRFGGGDQHAIAQLRDRVARNEVPGPRVFSVGSGVNTTPHAWAGSAAADTPNEARLVVRRLIADEQVDAILVTQGIDRPTLTAILEVAHPLDVPVIGQLWRLSARDAVQLGIDELENTSRIPECDDVSRHELFEARSVSRRLALLARLWVQAEAGRLDELAQLLAESGTTLALELVSFEAWAGLSTREVEEDRDWPKGEDDPQVAAYRRQVSNISHEWTNEDVSRQAEALSRMADFCCQFVHFGGRLATGTDSGLGGILLHREMAWLRRAGLESTLVIRAATRQAASALGRDDLGMLQAGRTADITLVRGDPIADLSALRNVQRVFVGGTEVYSAPGVERG